LRFVVPFAGAGERKTRLSPVMDERMREAFALATLRHVVGVLRGFGEVMVVTPDPELEVEGAEVVVDDSDLNSLPLPEPPFAVVMSDLPLLRSGDVRAMVEALEGADVVLCPSRRAGTAAVACRVGFRPSFGGPSFLRNLERARDEGLEVRVVRRVGFFADVDEPEDLFDVAALGEGEPAELARRVLTRLSPSSR